MTFAFSIAILALLITMGIIGLVIIFSRKDLSANKLMLLGINLTLFGGIIVVDPNSDIGVIGYIIAFLGLIISILGIGKKSE